MFRLKPSAFQRGSIILLAKRALPRPDAAEFSQEKIVTPSGQFRFTTPAELVFCPRFHWFALRVHTPFPIKGRIRFGQNYADIEGRLPLGSSLFFAGWVALWSVPLFLLFTGRGSVRETLPLVACGWAFALGLVGVSIVVERRRA
jgi:hypothetical protein